MTDVSNTLLEGDQITSTPGMLKQPNGWVWTSLEHLYSSAGYGSSVRCDYEAAGHPVLRIPNVRRGKIDLEDIKFATAEISSSPEDCLGPGDFLVIRTNGSKDLIGRGALIRHQFATPHFFASYLIRLRLLGNEVIQDYLSYYWDSPANREWIERNAASSAGQYNINLSTLAKLPVPLAPIAQQRMIVAEIDRHLSRLDVAVAALQRVQANLKRYRASVLRAACEGRLVPTEVELARAEGRDYEPAEVLLERILAEKRSGRANSGRSKRSTAPCRPSIDEFPLLPAGWTRATIDQITTNLDGRRIPVKALDRAFRPGPYAYYGASGVIDHIDGYLFDGEHLLVAEDGANLLSRSTPIAFQAKGRFWVNNHAHVVQTLGEVPLSYLELLLNGLDLRFHVTGSAQPKLTQAAMNRICVPLPPLKEQRRIVSEVGRHLSIADEVEVVLQRNLKRAEQLRQSILERAFEGKLVPQDPGDEPACALLDRIRAERAVTSNGKPKTKRTQAGGTVRAVPKLA